MKTDEEVLTAWKTSEPELVVTKDGDGFFLTASREELLRLVAAAREAGETDANDPANVVGTLSWTRREMAARKLTDEERVALAGDREATIAAIDRDRKDSDEGDRRQ